MSAERLHIILPTAYYTNLAVVLPFFLQDMEPHPYELRIHLMAQGPEPDDKGLKKTNEAVEMIKDGWLFMWADDTIPHPALFRRLHEITEKRPYLGAVCFATRRELRDRVSRDILLDLGSMLIQGGQVAWKREWLADSRYDANQGGVCDLLLAIKKLRTDPAKVFISDEVLTTFNSLLK